MRNTNQTSLKLALLKIKEGHASQDEIASSLTGRNREIALGLYHGYTQQGIEGFAKVYDALKVDSRLLQKWECALLDRQPPYAGILLSEVEPEPIDWLWKPRLALGKMIMLDGDPGLGKSMLTLNLAARISRGREWPDGITGMTGGTVIITPEDELANTIQPRLARMGANLTRISSLSTIIETDRDGIEYERPFCLQTDIPLIEREIERVEARLLIVDPLMAVVPPDIDVFKDNHLRAALAPLQLLVKQCKVACILVRHLTKSRGGNPLMAGYGSIAMIANARSGLMVIADPEIENQALLLHTKNNLGKLAPALRYSIESDEDEGDERAYVAWHGVSTATAFDLLNPSPVNTGGNYKTILDLLKERAPDKLTIQEIAETLPNMSQNNITVTLKRMLDKGEIDKPERGFYRAK